MGYEDSTTGLKRQVLVATAPNDAQALELVKELRILGLNVIIAETVGVAAMADEVAVCVAILRPETARHPAITTALRTNPGYLIPVLAEPMNLPRGPWSVDPLTVGESIPETARVLAELIKKHLQTLPVAVPSVRKNLSPNLQVRSDVPILLPRKRRRSNLGRPLNILFVLLILLLGAGILINYLRHLPQPISSSHVTQNKTVVTNPTYNAAVPGPGCDPGGADWATGSYFRDQQHQHDVADTFITTACQKDGILVSRTAHFDIFSNVFFYGPLSATIKYTFPRHYRSQVDATFVEADRAASIDMEVHVQDSGYGRYGFNINPEGRWQASRLDKVNGNVEKRLAVGFVSPSKTYTIGVEVDGPVMTLSLNKQVIHTVTDNIYPDAAAIAFGISDPGATTAPSALFSNFSYTPLPDTNLTTENALATATAQSSSAYQQPYSAPIPGYGCDKGQGQWKPVMVDEDYATAECLSNALKLSQGPAAKYLGIEPFYWLDGNFPSNYTVSVQLAMDELNGGCAGLTTRVNEPAGYGFAVCQNGYWRIGRFDDNGKFNKIIDGFVAAHSSYLFVATSNGSTQSLSLDGTQVASITDTTLTTTDHIDLTVDVYQGTGGAVSFTNFVFTPLP